MLQQLEQRQPRMRQAADWLALCFVPLWGLTLVLQILDVASVVLLREVNPVVLALVARLGLVPALLVKFIAAAAWLTLILGVELLCARNRLRVGTVICTLLVAVAAVFSAWVFWWNVWAVFFGK